MILDVHCQPFDRRIETGSFGNGPAFQNAVEFQTEIVMQVTCGMLLNNEQTSIFLALLTLRFGRSLKMTFSMVLL